MLFFPFAILPISLIGWIVPIREIGRIERENNIIFFIDAAQTAGVCEIDVNKDFIDMLAFTGHKGPLGPTGTGGLYVGEGVTLTVEGRGDRF